MLQTKDLNGSKSSNLGTEPLSRTPRFALFVFLLVGFCSACMLPSTAFFVLPVLWMLASARKRDLTWKIIARVMPGWVQWMNISFKSFRNSVGCSVRLLASRSAARASQGAFEYLVISQQVSNLHKATPARFHFCLPR